MAPLVNPHRGEAALEIGGRERVLVVDYNTLACIEAAADMSFLFDTEDEAAKKDFEKKLGRVNFIRIAVAAALSDDKRRVRPELVGQWLSAEPNKLHEAMAAVQLAISRFFSGLKPPEAKPANPPPVEAPSASASAGPS